MNSTHDRPIVLRRTPYGRAVVAQALMEFRLLLRAPESLVVILGIPLGILVFFSLVDVLPTGDRDAVTFLVPGVLSISVAATGLVAVAIQTAFERKYGVLKRIGGTPLPRSAFLLAKGAAVALVLSVQVALVFALAIGVLSWRPTAGLILVPLFVVLGALTMTALGLALAGAVRAEATLAITNATFLLFLVISGATFSNDALPEAMATVGNLLPVGALTTLLRAALDGAPVVWVGVVTLIVWGGAAVAFAARTFRWEP